MARSNEIARYRSPMHCATVLLTCSTKNDTSDKFQGREEINFGGKVESLRTGTVVHDTVTYNRGMEASCD